MHHGAVVPHHQVADPPRVPVDELALRRVLEQLAQQHAALGQRHAGDPRGVDADEKQFAFRSRVRAHQRPGRGWNRFLLLLGVAGIAQHQARMQRVVFRLQPRDLLLHILGQCVVGGAQVGVLSLAALGRHHHRVQHGVARRRLLERTVAVPELVGDVAEQLGVIA